MPLKTFSEKSLNGGNLRGLKGGDDMEKFNMARLVKAADKNGIIIYSDGDGHIAFGDSISGRVLGSEKPFTIEEATRTLESPINDND